MKYILVLSIFFSTMLQAKNIHFAKVVQTLNTKEYTFIKVNENHHTYWIASPHKYIEENALISFNEEMMLKDFKIPQIKTVFKNLMFVSSLYYQNRN